MSFFSKIFKHDKIKEEQYLALDIGSQTVKSLLFSVSENGQARIIAGGKIVRQDAKPWEGILADPYELISNCSRAIRSLNKVLLKDIKTIVGTSGETIRGEVTTVRFVRENPKEKIDLLELKNILQKIQWRAYEKIKRKLSLETGCPENEIRLISALVQKIIVDGYSVGDPSGLQGKEIVVSVFNSYAPSGHIEVIEQIGQALDLKIFYIASESFALAKALNVEMFFGEEGAILLDIGSAVTSVSLIRRGSYEGTKIFAMGGSNFTKRIANELGIGFWEAEEIKLKYCKGQLSARVSQKITKIFDSDLAVLAAGIETALMEFFQTDVFPSRIFITGGTSRLKGLEKYFKNYDWNQNLPFGGEPSVRLLQIDDFDNLEDRFFFTQSPEDLPAAALAGLTLKLLDEEDVLNKSLRRALRIVQFS